MQLKKLNRSALLPNNLFCDVKEVYATTSETLSQLLRLNMQTDHIVVK